MDAMKHPIDEIALRFEFRQAPLSFEQLENIAIELQDVIDTGVVSNLISPVFELDTENSAVEIHAEVFAATEDERDRVAFTAIDILTNRATSFRRHPRSEERSDAVSVELCGS